MPISFSTERRGICSRDRSIALSSLCFITGRFQSSFGWYSNPAQPLDPKQGLPPNTKTVANFMQDQGYVTGGVGKWHMGTADHQHPNALGYSDWYGFLGGGLTYYPLEHPSYKGRYQTLKRPWGVRDMHHTLPVLHNREPVEWNQYLTRELTDAGVAFIENNRDRPFFLFMSYNAPHLELEAPEETIANYPEASMTKVPGVSAKSRSIYAAMVDEMDQGIGRLLESLEKQGLTENTVVWFLSDSGGMNRTSDNRPLRGAKGSDYEGGLRVPLIVRWPGKVKPGTVLDHPVTSLDIGATLLTMAGGDVAQAGLHGVDIASYITGQTSQAPHETLYWRTAPLKQESGIVREGDFKLLMRRGKIELFNLKEDISETENIASSQLYNKEHVQSALNSLWRYNFVPDVGSFRKIFREGRYYAWQGDAGLLMCTWPNGGLREDFKEHWQYAYFNESMSGFEYQAAATMVATGDADLVQNGLAVARAIHDRYSPERRNPYNEIECSDHYARAMASYAVFLASCGFQYDGPAKMIGFDPVIQPENFRAPFTGARGWGTFDQKIADETMTAELSVNWGGVSIQTLRLSSALADADEVTVTYAGKKLTAKVVKNGNGVVIQWSRRWVGHSAARQEGKHL